MGRSNPLGLGVRGSGYTNQGTMGWLAMLGLMGVTGIWAGTGCKGITALGDSTLSVNITGEPRTGDGAERKGVDGLATGMALKIAACISAASATADDVSLSTTPLDTSQVDTADEKSQFTTSTGTIDIVSNCCTIIDST